MLKFMKNSRISGNEQGIVAIFTVLIVMGILTLLVIGFSTITRQAQKRTLDDQLSTQAFYAAETGINRAWSLINDGSLTVEKTDCLNTIGGIDFGYEIDPDLGISVSCLLVDLTPPFIRADSVPVGQAMVFYVGRLPSDPDISQFTVSWDSAGDRAADNSDLSVDPVFTDNDPRLLSATAWGGRVGMVRVDIIPISGNMAAALSRNQLATGSYSVFLYPSRNPATGGAGTISEIESGTQNQGITVGKRCSTDVTADYRCTATLRLGSSVSNEYYVRLQSYYNPTDVELTAVDTSNNEVEFHDSQAVIDSTGRVNDVYRRIQVSVPILSEINRIPGYHESFSILSASSLCKRVIGVPGASQIDGSNGASADAACSITD